MQLNSVSAACGRVKREPGPGDTVKEVKVNLDTLTIPYCS